MHIVRIYFFLDMHVLHGVYVHQCFVCDCFRLLCMYVCGTCKVVGMQVIHSSARKVTYIMLKLVCVGYVACFYVYLSLSVCMQIAMCKVFHMCASAVCNRYA